MCDIEMHLHLYFTSHQIASNQPKLNASRAQNELRARVFFFLEWQLVKIQRIDSIFDLAYMHLSDFMFVMCACV